MLAFMQLIVYFPLMDVKFPGLCAELYSKIITVVTFDIIPTDAFYPQLFSFKDEETLNDNFKDFDFASKFVNNLGSLFLLGTIILIQFPLYYIGRALNKYKLGRKIKNYYEESQFWNTPIEFINSAYVELAFACIINYMMLSWEGDGSNYGMYINNLYLFFGTFLIIGYPIWLFFFLRKNYYDL